MPLDVGSARVGEDSAKAAAATAVSLQVSDAYARVLQYARTFGVHGRPGDSAGQPNPARSCDRRYRLAANATMADWPLWRAVTAAPWNLDAAKRQAKIA